MQRLNLILVGMACAVMLAACGATPAGMTRHGRASARTAGIGKRGDHRHGRAARDDGENGRDHDHAHGNHDGNNDRDHG